MADEEEVQNPSRRNFLITTPAVIAGAGMGLVTFREIDPYFNYLIKDGEQKMIKQYNKPVSIIPLGQGHSIPVSQNPYQKMLIGEFQPGLVVENAKIEHQPIVEPPSYSGSNTATQTTLKLMYKAYEKYAIVAGTDINHNLGEIFYLIQSNDAKRLIATNLAKVLPGSVPIGVAATMDTRNIYKPSKEQKNNDSIDRRKFLKLAGAAGAGVASGAIGRTTSMYVLYKINSIEDFPIDTSSLTGLQKEIIEIQNPIRPYIHTLRENAMYLNSLALSSIDIPRIESVQASLGSGHIKGYVDRFDQNPQKYEQQVSDMIHITTQKHIDLLLKHEPNESKDDEALVEITAALHMFYKSISPLIIRTNTKNGAPSLDQIRERLGEKKCKTPHILLCEAMLEISDKIQNSEYSENNEENEKIKAMISVAFSMVDYRQEQDRLHPDKGFESGFAGNPHNKKTTIIEVFNKRFTFSSGITASEENI